MATRLDQLLAEIHPSRTLDEVASRVDRGANSFRFSKALITDYKEYQDVIAHFFAHVEGEVLRGSPLWPEGRDMYLHRAQVLLNEAYGTSGWKVAFEMARTGLEGGMRQVLDTLGERMALMYARNEIQARVSVFREELTPSQWLAAAEEYVAKFDDLLPSVLTEGGAYRLIASFHEVLIEHPFLLRRMSRLGR
jgi:glutathione S-transferase